MSEILTDGGRHRQWGAAETLRIFEETLDGRDSISVVARRNGVVPNLLYRWRQLMLEGGGVAVAGDDDVTSIAAVLNRQFRSQGMAPANHKRVYRIMAADRLLLAWRYTERPDYGHDGVVVAIRSNQRWCTDGFEFTCRNGKAVRCAFIIDAHGREIIAWVAIANAGIRGSYVRDIKMETVGARFGGMRAETPIGMLSKTSRSIPPERRAPLPDNLC